MNTNYRDIKNWNDIKLTQWNDWRWQLKNSIRSVEDLKTYFNQISFKQIQSELISDITKTFELKLTPHTVLNMIQALAKHDYRGFDSLCAAFVPNDEEHERVNEITDAIGEESLHCKPAPLVTNFYKNRALLFVSNSCPSYCRFCFRRRKVGDKILQDVERGTDKKLINEAINHIKNNKKIDEVIISGGDPLTLGDKRLFSILNSLQSIEHVKALRIDTKALTTLPQRITEEFVNDLKKYKPISIVGNFMHSIELTAETINSVSLLVNSGILVFSHTPLLKGINDDEQILANLMRSLYYNNIIPYYLIQFIPTKWTEHFRVPISSGLKIMKFLHSTLPGVAVPTYIVYLPDGVGKVPVSPNFLIEKTEDGYLFENFEGRKVLYKEPY